MDNKKVVSAVLASAIITSSSADVLAYKNFKDMPNNWARAGIENAVRHNLMEGYKDEVKPFDSMTRAEMATVMNRLLGLSETKDISNFRDVSKGKWYYNEMAKSVAAGIFMGSGDELHPEDPITREEAFLVISRVLDISKAEKSSKRSFTDYNKVSPWTLNAINGLVDFGYVQGDHMSRINPKGNITRAEFATLIKNISNEFVQNPSSIENKNVSGNLIVSSSGVKLKNVKVAGDLILTEGVGRSEVDLTEVKVSGRILVRAGSAVKLNSSQANQIRVVSGVNELNIEADKNSSIKSVVTSSKLSVKGDGKLDKVFFKKGSNGSKIDTKDTEVVVEDDIVIFDKDGKEIKLTSVLNDGKDKTDKDKSDKDKEAKKSYEILSIANVLDSKDTFVVDFGDKIKEENLKDRVITLEYLGKNVKSKYRLLDAEFLKLENGLATFRLTDKGAELEDRAEYRVMTKWISNKKEVKFTVETRINRREYDKLYDLIDDIYKLDKDKYERREYEALMDKAKDIDKKSRDINSVIELQQYVEELTRAKNTLVPVGAADLKSRLNLRMEILRKDKLKLPKELEDMPESSVKDIEKKLEEVNKLLVKNDKVMSRIEKAQRIAEDIKYSDDKWIQRALEESKDLKDTTIEEREKIADKLETALADEIKLEAEKDLAKLDKYADIKFEIKSGNLKEVKAALADAETSVKKYSGKDKDKLKGIQNIKKVKDKIAAFEKTGPVVDKTEKELEEAKKAYEAALKAASGKLDNIASLEIKEKNPTKADYDKATKAINEAIKKAGSEVEDNKDKEEKAKKELEEAKKAYEAAYESASKLDNIESLKVTGENPTKADYDKATEDINEAIEKAEAEDNKDREEEAKEELEKAKKAYEEALSSASGKLDNIESLKVTGENPTKADYDKATEDINEAIEKAEAEDNKDKEEEAKEELEKAKKAYEEALSSASGKLDNIESLKVTGENPTKADYDKATEDINEAIEKAAKETEAKEAVDALFQLGEAELELAKDVDEKTIGVAKDLVVDLEDSDLKKELTIKILKAEVLEKFKALEAEENKEEVLKFISEKLSELEKLEKFSEEDKAFIKKHREKLEKSKKTEEAETDDPDEASEEETSLETQAEEAVMALFQNK